MAAVTREARQWRLQRGGRGPLRLLLIEDEPTDRDLLLEGLQPWAEVVWCSRVAAGLEHLASAAFDALLLDLGLPDAQRLEGLERIQDAEHDIAVVVLTGGDTALALQALAVGAQDYLTKDELDPRLLSRSVHYAIERHALRRATNEGLIDRLSLERALERLVRSTHDAVVVLDPQTHQVLHASHAVGQLLGVLSSELVGTAPFGSPQSEGSDVVRRGVERPLEVAAGGEMHFVRARSFPTRWGGRRALALALGPRLDDSGHPHQRRAPHDDHLAAVGQLTAEVAHELGTPSAFMLANLSEIETGLGTPTPDHTRLLELTQETIAGARRISAILTDLRSVASAPATPAQAVRLDDVARAALNLLGRRVRGANVTLVREFDQTSAVMAVEGRLVQVAANLIGNALDAVDDHGAIRIVTREQDGMSRLEVHDDGPGLSAAAQQHAFEPFFTTKSSKRSMGLGLTISAELAGRFDGSLVLGDSPDGGCVAALCLPSLARGKGAARRRSGLQRRSVDRQRILLIDDERLVRRAYERMLASRYDLVTAESGAAALRMLDGDSRFDLILCDVEMPEMNGLSFLKLVQEHKPLLAERVALCTGGLRPEGLPAGILVLEKPVELATLVDLLGDAPVVEFSGS